MPKTMTPEQLVPVVEIADELGAPLELVLALLDREGAELLEDWRGRPAVLSTVAKAVVERRRREVAEHERREAERLAAERAWAAERTRVYDEAYREELEALASAFAAGVRQRYASLDAPASFSRTAPSVRARAAEAAEAAVAEWERKNPRPGGGGR